MALMTCPDCKTEMSDQAKACPKCGWVPFTKAAQPTSGFPFLLVGLVLGGGGTLGFCGNLGGSSMGIPTMLAAICGIAMFLFGLVQKAK